MKSERGQVIIILLLTMLVGLAVGVTITQRSITDVSISKQNEQASRAFSAAEAGIEKALQQESAGIILPEAPIKLNLDNNSQAQVTTNADLPGPAQALEYPPISTEEVSHFWLVDPKTLKSAYPPNSKIEVYFGNEGINTSSDDTPAIETILVFKDSLGNFSSERNFFDSHSTGRTSKNGFSSASCSPTSYFINSSFSSDTSSQDRKFKCKVLLDMLAGQPALTPYLLRVRVLYSSQGQKVAVKPYGSCAGVPCSIPAQATVHTSVGSSGKSQKTVRVFRQKDVVPSIFDFAVFSAGEIAKR